MTFHRLTNPGYYIPGGGPLLPGYDLLNDPSTTGGTGIPVVPDPGPKVGGVYDGVYFIADGANEPANAYNLNRPARALAESIDILDDQANQSIAVFTLASKVSAGDATYDIDASTDNVYTGGTGIADDFFHVVDASARPIFVDGERVRVSTSSVAIGSGFTAANPLTLTFNKTIPAGTTYLVSYAIRSAFKNFPVDAFAQKFAQPTLNMQGYRYDDDVVTVSGGGVSGTALQTRGDVHTTDLGPHITGSGVRGDWVLRDGSYTIAGSNNWSEGGHFRKSRMNGTVTISVDAARAANVNLDAVNGGHAFYEVSLGNDNTTYFFDARTDLIYESSAYTATVAPGALQLNGQYVQMSHRLSGLRVSGTSARTNATASLVVTGYGSTLIENSFIDVLPLASTPDAYLLFSGYAGRATIRNCIVGGTASASIDCLKIINSTGPTVFENCQFTLNGSDGWVAEIVDSYDIVFRNCRFVGQRGQALRIVNSGVEFIDCEVQGGVDDSILNPQLICGEGHTQYGPLVFTNCAARFSDSNVRTGVSTPTKAIIELGGHDNAAAAGPVRVNGLHVWVDSNSIGVHNYSTVVLHNHASNVAQNIYNDITVDAYNNDPGAPAGNKTYDNSYALRGAPLVEIVGSGASGKRALVSNLQLVRVGAPSAAVLRTVLQANYATIRGLVIDGSGAAAGSYGGSLIECYAAVDIFDVQLFPTAALKAVCTTGQDANIFLGQFGCRIFGLRYHHHAVWDYSSGSTAADWFKLNNDGVLADAFIYVDQDVAIAGTNALICVGNRSRLSRTNVVTQKITSGGALNGFVRDNGGSIVTVDGCTFRWNNVVADQIQAANFTGDFTTLVGNQFLTTSAAAVDTPTYAYAGATYNDLSVASYNAPNIAPAVY